MTSIVFTSANWDLLKVVANFKGVCTIGAKYVSKLIQSIVYDIKAKTVRLQAHENVTKYKTN